MTESKSVALTGLAIPHSNIKNGEPVGIRTQDTRLRRPLLYPAELRAHIFTCGADDENRTHMTSLEGWCSTTELHPHIDSSCFKKIGAEDEIRTRDPRLGKAMLYP